MNFESKYYACWYSQLHSYSAEHVNPLLSITDPTREATMIQHIFKTQPVFETRLLLVQNVQIPGL